MPRPIHFEIPAENRERDMRHYFSIFRWNWWGRSRGHWVISRTVRRAGVMEA
jgi:predicted enzyme related to lactoylglutathione lyase